MSEQSKKELSELLCNKITRSDVCTGLLKEQRDILLIKAKEKGLGVRAYIRMILLDKWDKERIQEEFQKKQ